MIKTRRYRIIKSGFISFDGEHLVFRDWVILCSGKPPYPLDEAFSWLLKQLKRGYINNNLVGEKEAEK